MINLLVTLGILGAGGPEADEHRIDFFEKRIRPVLVENCYECHSEGAEELEAGLLLDSREGWTKGGVSGPAVIPGAPGESLLIRAVRYEDPDLRMPPRGRLPKRVIADLERWVRLGAPDPRESGTGKEGDAENAGAGDAPGDSDSAPPDPHETWAFTPPVRPPVPAVRDASWPRSPIDRFILSRLEAEGLRPVEDAGRSVLIRRASFALHGLPPRPGEIERFLADSRPDAFERLVDRLLASPRFGERWGRHWLDVGRFAESSGGGRTAIFPNAWRYRDWVIDAFNEDFPYDDFVRWQVAGDLLARETPAESDEGIERAREQIVATGFLALGPKNLDDQDKEHLRMDVVDEQLDTLGRAFLGLTLGCARCHDHKFDPVPTRDYYAMAGILRSTKTLLPGNVSGFVESPLPGYTELTERIERHEELRKEVEGRLKTARKELDGLRAELASRALDGIVIDDTDAGIVGSWKRSTYHPAYVGEGYIHDEDAGKGEKSVTFAAELPAPGTYEVRLAYTPGTNRARNVPVTVVHRENDGSPAEAVVLVDQSRRPPVAGRFVSLGRFRFGKEDAAVVVSNRGTTAHVIADAAQFLRVDAADEAAGDGAPADAGPELSPGEREFRARIAEAGDRVKAIEERLASVREQAPPPLPKAMAVVDEEEPEDCRLCISGNVHNLGNVVPRGFLTAISSGEESPEIGEDESGRRELAEWLASPRNPLTARVMANRVWQHLFGKGLVRTPDNFGTKGEEPSHRDLLDWLALRFAESGWSVKSLVREIVLSRAWRLSSVAEHPRAAALDPENRLLWRQNRRRLEVEAIRDAVLLLSGELDLEAGGPSIEPSVSSELDYRFRSGRRSVYLPVFRNRLPEIFEVFDFADPNLVVGARSTSTLATQALFLMNSPFALEKARRAARSLLEVEGLDDRERVELAYLRVLGRPPEPAELDAALAHVRSAGPSGSDGPEASRLEAWSGLIHVLLGSIDFRYVE